MINLLFATPWWLLLTLAFVGGIVAWSGNQRQQGGTRNLGLAIIGVMLVLFALSFFFETDQEKVRRLNKALVQSVPSHNWPKMTDLLDPDATLGTVESTLFTNRTALVKGAQNAAARWGLRSVAITGTDEKQDPSGITIDVNVLSQQDQTDSFGIPGTISSWRFVWDRAGADWHCHQIICLKIGNENSGTVGQFIK